MANSTERIGVYHCGEIAEKNNWLFREQPINDIVNSTTKDILDTISKPRTKQKRGRAK